MKRDAKETQSTAGIMRRIAALREDGKNFVIWYSGYVLFSFIFAYVVCC